MSTKIEINSSDFGLTKLEYFTAMALCGLLSKEIYNNPTRKDPMIEFLSIGQVAISYAEATLKLLSNKEPVPNTFTSTT
jgi:hypothetical protein